MDPWILLPFFSYGRQKASRESRNWGNLAGCSLLKNKDINWAQTRSQHIREGTIDTKTVYPEWLLTPLRLKNSKTTLCFETNCLRKDQAYSQSLQLMLCENGHWTHFLSRVFCKSLNHVFQLPKTKKEKKKKKCKRTRKSSCWLQYSHKCHSSLGLHFKRCTLKRNKLNCFHRKEIGGLKVITKDTVYSKQSRKAFRDVQRQTGL